MLAIIHIFLPFFGFVAITHKSDPSSGVLRRAPYASGDYAEVGRRVTCCGTLRITDRIVLKILFAVDLSSILSFGRRVEFYYLSLRNRGMSRLFPVCQNPFFFFEAP